MSHTHEGANDEGAAKPVPINRPRLSGSGGDHGFVTPVGSPTHREQFLIPSPMVTRRTRTFSASRHAASGPIHKGICKFFSRNKGHGFVQPNDNPAELLFMHVSDIESEYIPLPGDELEFKKAKIPPKNEKYQAVEVRICKMIASFGKPHERWDQHTK